MQYQSFIRGKTYNSTCLTPKLCGVAAANTAQDRNAGVHLRVEQFNYLLAKNKCCAFSLSLPALRLRSSVSTHKARSETNLS